MQFLAGLPFGIDDLDDRGPLSILPTRSPFCQAVSAASRACRALSSEGKRSLWLRLLAQPTEQASSNPSPTIQGPRAFRFGIVLSSSKVADDLTPVASAADVQSMITLAQSVHVAPSLKGYIVDLAEATRRHRDLAIGVSPRAALGLQRAARARAAALGREYVVPDDLKELAFPVLEHRLALTPEAQMRGVARADVLADAVGNVKVPTGRSG